MSAFRDSSNCFSLSAYRAITPNIHTASLDELESVLGISRAVAKEIIKQRVEYRVLDTARLATIKDIGQKTVSLAEKLLSFEPIK